MFRAFFWSGPGRRKHSARAYGGALVLVLTLLAQIKVALVFNAWNGSFFDALTHATSRPESNLWAGLYLLGWIALGDIVFGTLASYMGSVYSLWWREALTSHYVPLWSGAGETIEGASQRIQQDPGELADIIEGIGIDFLRSVFTLIAFIPVLWILSEHMSFDSLEWGGTLPLIIIVVSFGGMLTSWGVGAFLPVLEYDNQKAEAAFRKQLVLAEERRHFLEAGRGWRILFADVVCNYHRLFRHYGYFNGWSTSYAKVMMLLPYALCIPSVHAGIVTLALMMQIVHAFGEVQGGFSFVLKNWTRVTKFRSVYRRLREFELALTRAHEPEDSVVVLPGVPETQDANQSRIAV